MKRQSTFGKRSLMVLGLLFFGISGVWLLQTEWGLLGEYFSNGRWEGNPSHSRLEKIIALEKGKSYKLPPKHEVSVKWTGWILISHPGAYRFMIHSDGNFSLWLNGDIVVDHSGTHGLQEKSGGIELQPGVYPIELRYSHSEEVGIFQSSWVPAGEMEQMIPANVLFPNRPHWAELLARKSIIALSGSFNTPLGMLTVTGLMIWLSVLWGNGVFKNDPYVLCPHKNLRLLSILLVLLPVAYIISLGFTLHRTPNNDYWGDFSHIFAGPKGIFFGKSNEHLVTVANFLFLNNYIITGGDNRGLFVWNLIIMGGLLFFGLKIATLHNTFSKRELLFIFPLLAILLFSPAPAHNWMISMSGTTWFLANFFLFASLYYLMVGLSKDSVKFAVLAAFLSVCGALSYSTGVFILFSCILFLLFYALCFRTGCKCISVYLVVGGSFYWWLSHFNKSLRHSKEIDLWNILHFVWSYIGNLFTENQELALIYGKAGMSLFLLSGMLLAYQGFYKKNTEFFLRIGPWFICMLYALSNMGAASLMREDPFALRYTNITTIFWVGLTVSMLISVKDALETFTLRTRTCYSSKIVYSLFSALLVVFVLFPMYKKGVAKVKRHQHVYREQELAVLALQLHMYDMSALRKISTVPYQVVSRVPLMESTRHVPFNFLLLPEYKYDKVLDMARLSKNSCTGDVKMIPLKKQIGRVYGLFKCSEPMMDMQYILLANTKNRLRGGAILTKEASNIVNLFQKNQQQSFRWKGFAKPDPQDSTLIVYAVLQDGGLVQIGQYQGITKEG